MRIDRFVVVCLVWLLPVVAAAADSSQSVIKVGRQPSEVLFSKITVADMRRSYDFYTKVVGLREIKLPALPKPVLDDPNVAFTEICLNFSGSARDPYVVLMKQRGVRPAPDQAKLFWVGVKAADTRAVVTRVKAA